MQEPEQTTGHAPAEHPSRRRFRLPTGVRSRILTAVLIITAAGMVFAGTLSYLLTRASTEDQISAQLEQEVSEFRQAVKIARTRPTGCR